MRLFFALSLPDGVKNRLSALPQSGVPVKWVPKSNLHVTLLFIGSVDDGTRKRIVDAATRVKMGPFDIELASVGAFPSRGRASVLWAGIEGDMDHLYALHVNLSSAFSSLDLKLGNRPFTPHVTLARSRRNTTIDASRWVESTVLSSPGPFHVNQFHLFSSKPTDIGSVYRVIASYPLVG